MTDPIQRISRSYEIHSQWYDWEYNQNRPSGGHASPKPFPAIPAVDEPAVQHDFDRFAQWIAERLAAVLSAAETLKLTTETLKEASPGSTLSRRLVEWAPAPALNAMVHDDARITTYLIRLDSVAQAQRNIGLPQKRTDVSPLAGSLCEFKLNSFSGYSSRISVAFGPADTNEQALRRIRRAVNEAKAGVTALLIRDRREDKLTLELKADATGVGSAFSLTDVQGDAAALTGIDRMVQAAENAIYTINEGTLVSSASNEVKLDEERLTLIWRESSAESVILSVYPDAATVKKQLTAVISRYNELIVVLQEAAEALNPDVSRDLLEDLPLHFPEELGILKQADHTLRLDDEKLDTQIRSRFDIVKARLTESGGLITQIHHAADKLTNSSPDTLLNKQNGAYRTLISYAYGPDKRLRSYLPVPITGYLMNFYS